MITKIISGGQTGADQAGLAAALVLGIETGGTAPPIFRTEKGSETYKLKTLYGLVEGIPDRTIYRKRTRQNIIDSDGTVVFGNIDSAGSRLTVNICKQLSKPTILNPPKVILLKWIKDYNIQTLNVAGNRESKNPGIYDKVYNFLIDTLKAEVVISEGQNL